MANEAMPFLRNDVIEFFAMKNAGVRQQPNNDGGVL